jgi:hypothetical protein
MMDMNIISDRFSYFLIRKGISPISKNSSPSINRMEGRAADIRPSNPIGRGCFSKKPATYKCLWQGGVEGGKPGERRKK